jgi:hypothetical protein
MGWTGTAYGIDPDELQDSRTDALMRLYAHLLRRNDDRDFELKSLLFKELCAREEAQEKERTF